MRLFSLLDINKRHTFSAFQAIGGGQLRQLDLQSRRLYLIFIDIAFILTRCVRLSLRKIVVSCGLSCCIHVAFPSTRGANKYRDPDVQTSLQTKAWNEKLKIIIVETLFKLFL